MVTYQVKMENFEGPLDLLCHLVEKNKMNIYDIKINDITNQYLDYLELMQQMNLEVTSDFIIMASRLIYMKSKMLLPTEEEEEEEIDLVQVLIEYKKYKESTLSLKEKLDTYGGKFYRLAEKVELPKGKLEKTYPKSYISEIYSEMITREIDKKNANADNVKKLAVNEKVTILSKVKEILTQLRKKQSFVFNRIFNSNKQTKNEIVTAFLSLLELSRMKRVVIKQNSLFGNIEVIGTKRKKI